MSRSGVRISFPAPNIMTSGFATNRDAIWQRTLSTALVKQLIRRTADHCSVGSSAGFWWGRGLGSGSCPSLSGNGRGFTFNIALELAVALLAMDALALRLVSGVFDRERLVMGAKAVPS
jgi:hypothetical protein